eukprot:m.1203234 g.1203234  ORF g.1203234 m.1203234 type:complete len:450 (-) comp24578_c0_seq8:2049-3398(-)
MRTEAYSCFRCIPHGWWQNATVHGGTHSNKIRTVTSTHIRALLLIRSHSLAHSRKVPTISTIERNACPERIHIAHKEFIFRSFSTSGTVQQRHEDGREQNYNGSEVTAISIVDNAASTLRRILPNGISFMVAYGSGVLKQANIPMNVHRSPPMIDFLLATEDPIKWHETNMKKNPSHYSGIARALGSRRIVQLSQAAAGIYFNTHVDLECGKVKYGVASTHDFKTDLREWNRLYIAGRLHKPVKLIVSDAPEIVRAYDDNLRAAISTAILMLPQTFTETELFMAIASISYTGDPRMIVGENRHKVDNIVKGQFSAFQSLYRSQYERCCLEVLVTEENSFGIPEQQLRYNPALIRHDPQEHLIRCVPQQLRSHMLSSPDTNLLLADFADASDVTRSRVRNIVQLAIKDVVSTVSARQTMLGIVSAGFSKTLRYAAAKGGKWLDGLRQDQP